jgi:hypothetical protein
MPKWKNSTRTSLHAPRYPVNMIGDPKGPRPQEDLPVPHSQRKNGGGKLNRKIKPEEPPDTRTLPPLLFPGRSLSLAGLLNKAQIFESDKFFVELARIRWKRLFS